MCTEMKAPKNAGYRLVFQLYAAGEVCVVDWSVVLGLNINDCAIILLVR